jgi:hypothetical protein
MAIYGQDTCDCSEINLLKDIVQQIMWEQKVESAKLAKLEAGHVSRQVSPGGANKDCVERIENMEREMVDINKKLEKLLKIDEDSEKINLNVVHVLKRTISSETLERLSFVTDVKNQMTDMEKND